MSSFRFPQQLLHSTTEPQWFPRPKEEKESSLDALEKEEAEYIEKLRAQVLPPAPDPIGIAGEDSKKSSSSSNPAVVAANVPQPEVDLTALPSRPLFWTQHRTTIEHMRELREHHHDETMMLTTTDNNTSMGRPSAMSMDLSRTSISSSFSLTSPTSRTG